MISVFFLVCVCVRCGRYEGRGATQPCSHSSLSSLLSYSAYLLLIRSVSILAAFLYSLLGHSHDPHPHHSLLASPLLLIPPPLSSSSAVVAQTVMRVCASARLCASLWAHHLTRSFLLFRSSSFSFLSLHPNHPDIGTRSFCRCARLCLCPRMSGGACVSLLVCVCLCVGVWGCRCTSRWASPRHNLLITVFVLLRALVFFLVLSCSRFAPSRFVCSSSPLEPRHQAKGMGRARA